MMAPQGTVTDRGQVHKYWVDEYTDKLLAQDGEKEVSSETQAIF